jgi:two-component sensor histidine kinase/ABC-type nitrate/sulfonate/bicarbonate transport system substrate-binding protein
MPAPQAARAALLAILAAASLQLLQAEPPVRRAEKVVLQLKWRNQFQFAGYYMAAKLGYYRDEGLDVLIKEGSPSTRFTDEVMEGRAQFGVNNTDLLIDRANGKKPVVLAVIFQHSPLILLSLKKNGLSTPADFANKRVMVSLDAEAEIYSIFKNESIPIPAVGFVRHSWSLDELVKGRVDAISAYITNEPSLLRKMGVAFSITRPITYGIDFYGDCLFTSESELKQHPATCAAFLRASLKGWDYALDHVEEACDTILADYHPDKSREELLEEAAAMDELIVHKFVPIGFMNPGRWQHIGDTYARLGFIPKDYSLDGFLYDPASPRLDPGLVKALILVLAAAAAALIAYIAVLRAFNSRLASEVGARTNRLAQLNEELKLEMRQRAEKEAELAASLAEKVVLLKEIHHRVKNNLQIISSIVSLELEKSGSGELSESLKEIRSRVFSMALVHEQLYEKGDLSRIDMADYLRRLVGEVRTSFRRPGTQVSLDVRVSGIWLEPKEAMPIGLIVGELVANSMKFAFEARENGRIEVSLSAAEGQLVLEVSDDGIGCDGLRMDEPRKGLGIGLVEALTAQLGGELRYPPVAGRSVVIVMPLPG